MTDAGPRAPARPSAGARRAGAVFATLVDVMDRLRSPGGCPWDAEQTHASLARYAIEEAHEVAEAAESGDLVHLRDELGDLLLQVVFQARVGEEDAAAPFDVTDVVTGLVAKLERRHPHVFGEAVVTGAEEVAANWDLIKRAETGRRGLLDGVPHALPALLRAQKAVERALRAGAAPPSVPGAAAGLGERLLALVAEAAATGRDAEGELRRALARWVTDGPDGPGGGNGPDGAGEDEVRGVPTGGPGPEGPGSRDLGGAS